MRCCILVVYELPSNRKFAIPGRKRLLSEEFIMLPAPLLHNGVWVLPWGLVPSYYKLSRLHWVRISSERFQWDLEV